MRRPAFKKPSLILALTGIVWLVVIAGGFAVLHRYESTPASSGTPVVVWPSETPLVLESDRLTLVLAMHPRCPCTEATVAEVNDLLKPRSERGRLNALVFKPASAANNWLSTKTVDELSVLPDSRIWTDEEGVLAARFGAVTSGTLLIFNPQGDLLFAGGVTPVRGQMGPNVGASAVAALLDGKAASANSSPVFGCSLVSAPSGSGGVR